MRQSIERKYQIVLIWEEILTLLSTNYTNYTNLNQFV